MKNLLIASIAMVALMTGAAQAADMSMPMMKAPVAPVAAPSWSGFYLGAGFGAGVLDSDWIPFTTATGAPLTRALDNGGKGWMAKFVVGYDYQFYSNMVLGVFGSYDPNEMQGTAQSGITNALPSDQFGATMKESYDWAVGARLGWVLTPTIFTYADGGFTQARLGSMTLAGLTSGAVLGTLSAQTYSGWFTGGGFVTPVPLINIPGLFLDTEYRYSSFNNQSQPIVGSVDSEKIRFATQTVTTSLVYKFNWH
jgi:outer membrane immunogenic protein